MKENELRSGIYVYRVGDKDIGLLEDKEVVLWDSGIFYRIGDCVDSLENYEPIPLTEEWLIRFGLIDRDNVAASECKFGEYIKTGFMCILSKEYETNGYQAEYRNDIKYVHQLQNLYYCLTGEELMLDAFSVTEKGAYKEVDKNLGLSRDKINIYD